MGPSRIGSVTCTDQESTTFKTLYGNIEVLAEARPLWIVLENVDITSDGTDDDSSAAIIAKMLSECGYASRLQTEHISYFL